MSEIVKIVENCEKMSKIVKNCQNCQKLSKLSKFSKKKSKLSKCWLGHVSSLLWTNVPKVKRIGIELSQTLVWTAKKGEKYGILPYPYPHIVWPFYFIFQSVSQCTFKMYFHSVFSQCIFPSVWHRGPNSSTYVLLF